MFVADLEHLEVLSPVQPVADALQGASLLSLSIRDGVLSLSLGDSLLYTAPLATEVTEIRFAVEEAPGVKIVASSQVGNGDVKSSAYTSVSSQDNNAAFASAAASVTSFSGMVPAPVLPLFRW